MSSISRRPSHVFAIPFTVILALVASFAMPSQVAAADLDNSQKSTLNGAIDALRRARVNYDLAARSVSGRVVSSGKKKLALIRLDSAGQSAAQASKALATLPADNASVANANKASDQIHQAIADLKKRLTQPATPPANPKNPKDPANPGTGTTPNPPTPPKPAPPLPASQNKQLGEVDLLLRMVDVDFDNLTPMITNIVREVVPQGAQIQSAVGHLQRNQQRLRQAAAILKTLPGNHPKVASVIAKWRTEAGRAQKLTQQILPSWKKLQAAAGMSKFPNYAKDMDKLTGLSRTYGSFAAFQQRPEDLAEVIENDKAVASELARIETTYKPLFAQATQEGTKLANSLRSAKQRRARFLADMKQYQPSLVSMIRTGLEQAGSLRTQAIAEKKPLFLTGGVEQQLTQAEKNLAVLRAYAPATAAPFEAQVKAERQRVEQAKVTLRSSIIEANRMPNDTYAGKDRDQLIAMATAAWKKLEPNAQVLAVRIPSRQWKRSVKWRASGDTLTKSDTSKLQISLIVAAPDAKLAIIRPINLWKNHLEGDTVGAYPFYTLKDALQPSAYLLRSNVR